MMATPLDSGAVLFSKDWGLASALWVPESLGLSGWGGLCIAVGS